jgi:hypothetical protein
MVAMYHGMVQNILGLLRIPKSCRIYHIKENRYMFKQSRYHVISNKGKWRLFKENGKRGLIIGIKSVVIQKAINILIKKHGRLFVHLTDASVDWCIDL